MRVEGTGKLERPIRPPRQAHGNCGAVLREVSRNLVWGVGFRVSGVGFRVSGFGRRVSYGYRFPTDIGLGIGVYGVGGGERLGVAVLVSEHHPRL